MSIPGVTESPFLPRLLEAPPAEDFALLRKQGIEHVERLASRRWTDYNVHDPGITLLELACYGLTDVGMRTAYPVRDLLTTLVEGLPEIPDGAFHLRHEILVSAPVTFDDLRKVLVDIRGVRNAWVEAHKSVVYRLDRHPPRLTLDEGRELEPLEPLNGLYDVYLEYEDFVREGEKAYRALTSIRVPDAALADGPIEPQDKGLDFRALADARLMSVAVYAAAAGPVTVRLLDAGGAELGRRTVAAAAPGNATRVELGFDIKAGRNYRLDAKGTTIRLQRTVQGRFPFKDVKGVVELLRGYPSEGIHYFFYDWEIAYDSTGMSRDEVRAAAIERLRRNRNLCEDAVNVCELRPEQIALCADIELAPEADTEAVQAEIFYAMHLHISPPVRFYSAAELLARGRTVDQVFEGPLLEHGFIDHEEFLALRRRCEIRVSDVVQKLMDVKGVVAIKNVRLLSFVDGDEPRLQAEWVLTLDSDRSRIPRFAPQRSKVVFYKRGLPYYASRDRVNAIYEEKKSADIQAKLKSQDPVVALMRLERDFAAGAIGAEQHSRERRSLLRQLLPPGVPQLVSDYYPLQNELPATYCVGRIRLPASETPQRRAQQRQLKAYLLFFEQTLANLLAQLAHLDDLFSWRGTQVSTYFTQAVTEIADLADIYACPLADLPERLRAMVETTQHAEGRRLRLLEHLAARYAESFERYEVLMRAMERSAERLIGDKRRFLTDYPELSSRRSQGPDYRFPEYGRRVPGFQLRVYRLLGIEDATHRELSGHRFSFVERDGRWYFRLAGAAGGAIFESIGCESKSAIEALLDFCLDIGAKEEHYAPNLDATWRLERRCAEEEAPDIFGHTLAAGDAGRDETLSYFRRYGSVEGFHLVEHVLLRPRSLADPVADDLRPLPFLPVQLPAGESCDCEEARDPYSFRASVVLPSWSARFRDVRFRQLAEDTLRAEAPAHVQLRICWVSHAQMEELEVALHSWRARLAEQSVDAGRCDGGEDAARTGRLELPRPQTADKQYAKALERLIAILFKLVSIYPLARMHDCEEVRGDEPQVALNFTRLGTQ